MRECGTRHRERDDEYERAGHRIAASHHSLRCALLRRLYANRLVFRDLCRTSHSLFTLLCAQSLEYTVHKTTHDLAGLILFATRRKYRTRVHEYPIVPLYFTQNSVFPRYTYTVVYTAQYCILNINTSCCWNVLSNTLQYSTVSRTKTVVRTLVLK